MQFALSGFLFEEDYKRQAVSFAVFCRIAAQAGYEAVELRRTQVNPDTPAGERAEIRRIAEDHCLTVSGLTARGIPQEPPERDDALARYLELCADLGCGLLKVGGEPQWLRGAADKAQEMGVALATNNHVGGAMQTVAGTRERLAAVAHPNYGLLFDPMHLYIAGEEYVGCIAELAQRMKNVLVQSVRREESQRPPLCKRRIERNGTIWVGDWPDAPGVQDWPAIFAALKQAGYDGLVTVIENGWPEHLRTEAAQRNLAYLRRLTSDTNRWYAKQ